MRSIEKNIKVDILYRIFSNLDFTSAIWVLYLSSKGISLVKIGILESIFHITSFICETPTGAIADLLGRRNTLVMGRLMAFVSSIIMLISNSFLGFALGFVFSALSFNLNSGSEEALIYDTLKELEKEKEYSNIISKLNVVIEVASGIAVFIGGILSEKSFVLSYVIAALISLTALNVALLFKEPKYKCDDKVNIKKHFKESYFIIKDDSKIKFILFFFPLVDTFTAMLYFYGQKFFEVKGFSITVIAIIFVIKSICSTLGNLMFVKIKRILKKRTIFIMISCISICLILVGFLDNKFSVILFVIVGFFDAILYVISSTLLNKEIPSEQRATLISVDSMSYSAFMIILFPLAGYLGEKISLSNIFIILGIVLFVINIININNINKFKI